MDFQTGAITKWQNRCELWRSALSRTCLSCNMVCIKEKTLTRHKKCWLATVSTPFHFESARNWSRYDSWRRNVPNDPSADTSQVLVDACHVSNEWEIYLGWFWHVLTLIYSHLKSFCVDTRGCSPDLVSVLQGMFQPVWFPISFDAIIAGREHFQHWETWMISFEVSFAPSCSGRIMPDPLTC